MSWVLRLLNELGFFLQWNGLPHLRCTFHIYVAGAELALVARQQTCLSLGLS